MLALTYKPKCFFFNFLKLFLKLFSKQFEKNKSKTKCGIDVKYVVYLAIDRGKNGARFFKNNYVLEYY